MSLGLHPKTCLGLLKHKVFTNNVKLKPFHILNYIACVLTLVLYWQNFFYHPFHWLIIQFVKKRPKIKHSFDCIYDELVTSDWANAFCWTGYVNGGYLCILGTRQHISFIFCFLKFYSINQLWGIGNTIYHCFQSEIVFYSELKLFCVKVWYPTFTAMLRSNSLIYLLKISENLQTQVFILSFPHKWLHGY